MFRRFLWLLSYAPSTNPITILIYGVIAIYGCWRIKKLNVIQGPLRYLKILGSAASILLVIIFVGEIVWWTIFSIRYNVIFDMWRYQIGAFLWIISLSLLCLYSMKVFPKHVGFINKKTILGFGALTLYILILFMLTPTYFCLNWRDGLVNNASNTTLFISFFYPIFGKSIIAYIHNSVYKK